MKKITINLLIFLTLVIILDRSFILFRPNEVNIFNDISKDKLIKVAPRINQIETPDILIVGSSHAQFGISPELLTKKLNRTALNLAYGGGANIGAQLTLFQKMIKKRIIPKIIIFGMDVFTLNAEPEYSDEFQKYLFKEPESISDFLQKKMFHSYFQLYSRFIPNYISQIKSGNFSLPYFNKIGSYDLSMFRKYEKYEITKFGWVKGYGFLNKKKFDRYSKVIFNPNKNAKNDLNEYILLCKKLKIDIVFIQIPEHNLCLKWNKKYTDFNVWMNQFSKNNGIPYWNFNNLINYSTTNDSLFFDSDHLNVNGAKLFSANLVQKIKQTHLLQ
jgi:hypothetical protein